MNGTEFGLVLAFDTDNQEFVRGVQVGMLWERIEQAGFVDHQLTYASNAEMVMRMAGARDLPFSAEDVGDGWLCVTIGAPPPAWRTAKGLT